MSATTDRIRVLHVDDTPDLADLAATFLQREDERLTVETASSTGEGLNRLADAEFDCVVSDYDMPGQTGIEFLRTVRERYEDLPFILFTGKGSEEVASDAIAAGVTDYLQKESGSSQYTVLAHRVVNAVEQYRSRQAVEATERKLSQLAEKTDDVLFMFSADWSDLLFANSAFEDIWGVPASELKSDPESFLDYVHPEDRQTVRETMAELSAGDAAEIEYRVERPDGDQRWVRVDTKPIFDDGTVSRIVGFVRDITDEKERKRELEQARRDYEELFNGMNDTAWVIDDSEQFLAVNDAAAETVGYSKEELLSMRPHDIDAGLDGDEITALIREMPDDETQVFETVHVTSDDRRIPVEISSGLISYQGEKAVLSIARDISARKRREKQLETFAYVVSHDLRNPLSVADGRLELARGECDSEHLDKVAQAHDRMDGLIEDLLALAREGDSVRDQAPIDLSTHAENCWENVETADATLRTTVDATIVADRSRLKQLLENLMRNAVEHGGERVTVTVGGLTDGFYVEDDGRGIPQQNREDVFTVGYSTEVEGTGLGLNIVEEVAETHGWAVRITESTDGGARFEVTGVEFDQ